MRGRLITKEIIIGTHAPRAVGLTIGLPPHLHLLLGSYGRGGAREPHMPMAFLRDKPPGADSPGPSPAPIDPAPVRGKGEFLFTRHSCSLHIRTSYPRDDIRLSLSPASDIDGSKRSKLIPKNAIKN